MLGVERIYVVKRAFTLGIKLDKEIKGDILADCGSIRHGKRKSVRQQMEHNLSDIEKLALFGRKITA